MYNYKTRPISLQVGKQKVIKRLQEKPGLEYT